MFFVFKSDRSIVGVILVLVVGRSTLEVGPE